MKIVQINTFSGNSTGKIALEYYKSFELEGHTSYFAFARGKIPNIRNYYIIGSKLGIMLDGFLTRITDKCGGFSRKTTKDLINWLKEVKPDVIYLHNLHGYYLNYKLLFRYLKASKTKVVWTLHDCWAYTGHCAYYTEAKCELWKTGCHNCKLKKSYPKSLFFDRSKKNFFEKKKTFQSLSREQMTLIVPSNWLKEQVEQSFLSKYEIKVRYNTIDKSVFKPRKSTFREDNSLINKVIILSVASSWEKRKGLDFLLELSNQLPSKYKIVIVGVTRKQIERFKNFNILFIARTKSQYELAEIYSAADIYFSASTEETFGMTFLEAYDCGCKKIIGFDQSAVPEVLALVNGYSLKKELCTTDYFIEFLKSIEGK